MIKTPLDPLIEIIYAQTDAVGVARNAYLAKKAEKRNLESSLRKIAEGKSQNEKSMNADATEEWLHFEKELNRLEAIYEFQKDKLEVMNKEYQAQYLELKDNEQAVRRRGA